MPGSPTITLADIEAARAHVAAWRTGPPLFNSRVLSELVGSSVVYKAENLQRTGSFKVRGVSNKLASLGRQADAGIVVAQRRQPRPSGGVRRSAARHPLRGLHAGGGLDRQVRGDDGLRSEVHFGGEGIDDCLEMARERVVETGDVLVHPFDDEAVIAGQGSLGLELVEDVPDLATVLVPLGGGGLAGGIAVAIKSLRPSVTVDRRAGGERGPVPCLDRSRPHRGSGRPPRRSPTASR